MNDSPQTNSETTDRLPDQDQTAEENSTAARIESDDTVYGRLLESVHIAGYSLERAFAETKILLKDGRWKAVGGGFENVSDFVRSISFRDFRMLTKQRKELVEMFDEAEASQRAIADALGVGLGTVNNDLKAAVQNRTPEPEKTNNNKGENAAAVQNRTPPPEPESWVQDKSVDPAKLAKLKSDKNQGNDARKQLHQRDIERVSKLQPIEGKFRALVVDPPWDYEWLSLAGRAKPGYATMSHDELLALDVAQWAEDDCHLYLWVTNNFMTRGVELMREWGFQHKTVLTWAKSRWGLGSYFRNQTEHVLFGVRGELRTKSDSISTIFDAPLGAHSEKPEKFYEIVREASFGPYGEIFQREPRPDFTNVFVEETEAVA